MNRIEVKECTKCREIKILCDFYKRAKSLDGLSPICRSCDLKRSKQYSIKNRERLKAYRHQYYLNNIDYKKIQQKQYAKKNAARIKNYKQKWYQENKSQIAEQIKKRLKCDLEYKLGCYARSRLNRAILDGAKTGSAVRDLGCTIDELKQHLAAQFQPGMCWENWSSNGWHMDHIIPLAYFDLTEPQQFQIAVHYSNVQPLWAKDNVSKKDKLSLDEQLEAEMMVHR